MIRAETLIVKLQLQLPYMDDTTDDSNLSLVFFCSCSKFTNKNVICRPITLELSPEEEIVASMYMDIIR